MKERTVSVAWIQGIHGAILSAGLDPASIFNEAGIDPAALANPEARFTPDQISLLWEIAAERAGNPALGLIAPAASTPVSFDAVAYVMMSCPNLLVGLERMIRYLRIVSDAAELALVKEADGHALTVTLVTGARPMPRQRVEFVVVTILNFCRWISGRQLHPIQVDLVNPEPPQLQPYREVFRCPIRFNAPVHRILFSDADLAHRLPTANPVLAELHDQHATQYLDRLDSTKVTSKTRELMIARLPDGDPSRAEIARALCISERTLQRRLQDEGTSYQDLLDDTRQALAQQYLRRHDLTLVQITYLLGFGDQSSFSRACKRWFALSPGEYRNSLTKPPAVARR